MEVRWPKLEEGWLKVCQKHKIYYAEYGDKEGIPIASIHGGPGSQSKLSHLEYLPEGVRVILFDQRGCGLSQPFGEIRRNTTQDLVRDMEKLRKHLGIDKWIVVGGSWGSTLALVYAETYPERVLGLGLRSVFLARKQDAMWGFSKQGAGRFYPEGWQRLEIYAQEGGFDLGEIVDYGWRVLSGNDLEKQKEFVALMRDWEGNVMKFEKKPAELEVEIGEEDVAMVKLFWYYWRNEFFLKEDQILKEIEKIRHLPAVIVHGRYDLECPPEQAWLVHRSLPKSELFFSTYAGHHLGIDGKLWFKKLLTSLLLIV